MKFLSLMSVFGCLWLIGCGSPQPEALPSKSSPQSATNTELAKTESGTAQVAIGTAESNTQDTAEERRGVDWPTFLGPSGDSKSPETGLLKKWPPEGPAIVWQSELGISYGIGSISHGRLFQFDRYDEQARLTCLNAESGAEIWRFEYPTNYSDLYSYNGGPRCSPVVDAEHVYTFGVEGMLHCLTTADGKPVWKINTAKEFGVIQNFFGVGSTPVVDGDLLIVMIGGSPPESRRIPPGQLDRVTGNGTGIVAFDKRTGEVRYKITDELASYASLKLATINGRRWCFAFCRGGLVGFEPATGKVDFTYPWRATLLESVNASTPVVVDDEVFISETYSIGSSLLRVAPGTHEVVWADDPLVRQKSMLCHWNTPIYIDGYLYGCSGRNSGELRCIEWKTGKVQWNVPRRARSSLLFADGKLICLEEDGNLMLLNTNPKKLDVISEVRLDQLTEPCWAAPILSHGRLYVRGNDRLVCLDVRE